MSGKCLWNPARKPDMLGDQSPETENTHLMCVCVHNFAKTSNLNGFQVLLNLIGPINLHPFI
jgi:hypothetical protein